MYPSLPPHARLQQIPLVLFRFSLVLFWFYVSPRLVLSLPALSLSVFVFQPSGVRRTDGGRYSSPSSILKNQIDSFDFYVTHDGDRCARYLQRQENTIISVSANDVPNFCTSRPVNPSDRKCRGQTTLPSRRACRR